MQQEFCTGTVLSSQAVASQVFSTLMSLTSVFGMGTGGTSSLSTPIYSGSNLKIEQSTFMLVFASHITYGQALDRLVPASCTPHGASTLGLSTL